MSVPGLGPFRGRNTDSWEQQSDIDSYKATLRVKKNSAGSGRISANRQNRDLRVIVNSATGAFDVYETNFLASDRRIGSYSPSTNKFSAVAGQEEVFDGYFAGEDNKTQRERVVRTSKETVLALSGRNALGPTARKRYNTIAALPGYQSLSGATPNPPETKISGASAAGDSSSDPAAASVQVDPVDGSTLETTTETTPSSSRKGITDEGSQFTDNNKKFYAYPRHIPDFGYDFIQFKAYRYEKAGLESYDVNTRYVKNEKVTITLPMQPNFSESNSVDWGGDKVNPLQLALGRAASGLIQGIGNLSGQQILATAAASMAALKENAKDPASEAALIAYFAGQAVGANIFTRATGTVLNPNMELLFTGPRLRTFAFNFKMTPRSEPEAKEIRDIIKTFKKYAAPIRSTSNLFLQTPHIFRINYIYNPSGESQFQHPYLNKIKPCALTSFNVNYTPEGSYMTYDGGSLPSYEIAMSFGELQPIYANDYDENSNDMGF
jgi:hypothetical protein